VCLLIRAANHRLSKMTRKFLCARKFLLVCKGGISSKLLIISPQVKAYFFTMFVLSFALRYVDLGIRILIDLSDKSFGLVSDVRTFHTDNNSFRSYISCLFMELQTGDQL